MTKDVTKQAGSDIFNKIANRDREAARPEAKLVLRYRLLFGGRASTKLYTKVQINRMVKNLEKRGVFAYGSPMRVWQYTHHDGHVTY